MNKKLLGAFVLSALFSSGCASITQGTSQTIIFNIDPKPTRCEVSRVNDGVLGYVSQRMNSIEIGKDKDDIIVKCAAAGYKPLTVRLVSHTQASGVIGGAFLDLGITDMITGAMWKYDGTVNIALQPEESDKPSTMKILTPEGKNDEDSSKKEH